MFSFFRITYRSYLLPRTRRWSLLVWKWFRTKTSLIVFWRCVSSFLVLHFGLIQIHFSCNFWWKNVFIAYYLFWDRKRLSPDIPLSQPKASDMSFCVVLFLSNTGTKISNYNFLLTFDLITGLGYFGFVIYSLGLFLILQICQISTRVQTIGNEKGLPSSIQLVLFPELDLSAPSAKASHIIQVASIELGEL